MLLLTDVRGFMEDNTFEKKNCDRLIIVTTAWIENN